LTAPGCLASACDGAPSSGHKPICLRHTRFGVVARDPRFGRVAASLRRTDRESSAPAYDAMIAATALANGLALYTCNPADFADIDGLELMPVPVPEE
jgi:predicted nucleic acid-binding protein